MAGEHDVEGTTERIAKWTKMYDRHTHRALANEGLAPQLYNIWRHPTSLEWVEVSMETLGPEWVSLEDCVSKLSEEEWNRACEAVELAFERAQRVEMPDGRVLKIDGPTARYIMVKVTEDAAEVLFTGYDQMEWEAERPEAAMGKYEHPLRYETKPLHQNDSSSTLSRKLFYMANRTKPLPPYPTPPAGKMIVHASMTQPIKLRHCPGQDMRALKLGTRGTMCFLGR